LEEEVGYTSTVGISTNKLLSKLVGNVNKPQAQTTLCPPYSTAESVAVDPAYPSPESNVTKFIDGHEIGKIPGIGFKTSQRLRNLVLSKPANSGPADGHAWDGMTDAVRVRDVRLFPSMGPELLEKVLGGPGAERGIGGKIWGLINGIDDSEVQKAKRIPTQISIEDSYSGLQTMAQVSKELQMLARSLVNRMHTDLLEDDDDDPSKQRWMAHPKTVRLSTRPRPPLQDDGARARSFNRISKSGPLPNFVFNLNVGVDATVEKLVQECLVPMFKRLHPPQTVWNLNLINIGVTNMVETGSDDSGAGGRDISKMFRRQEDVLREWKVEDKPVPPDPMPAKAGDVSESEQPKSNHAAEPSAGHEAGDFTVAGSEDMLYPSQETLDEHEWEDEGVDMDVDSGNEVCGVCGAVMPAFAMGAHERFHSLEE
jgi:DNA polymerase iota